MAHNPPINRRQLGKDGHFDEDIFFEELALECGISDTKTVRQVYLGLVRLLNKRMLTKYVCRLPHLGDFALPMQKSRSVLAGKGRTITPPRRALKFYALEKWTKHIAARLGYTDLFR